MAVGKRSLPLFWAGREELKLHTHKTPFLAVTEEWTGWKGLLETTLEAVSAVPLHARPLHAPGERKARDPGAEGRFPPTPAARRSSSVRITQERPQLGGFNCHERSHFLLIWATALTLSCTEIYLSHFTDKETEKGCDPPDLESRPAPIWISQELTLPAPMIQDFVFKGIHPQNQV